MSSAIVRRSARTWNSNTSAIFFLRLERFELLERLERVQASLVPRISQQLLNLAQDLALFGDLFFQAALAVAQIFDPFFQLLNIVGKTADRLGDGVGQISRIKIDNRFARRRVARFDFDNLLYLWDSLTLLGLIGDVQETACSTRNHLLPFLITLA